MVVLDPLVNGFALQGKEVLGIGEILGVTDKQQAAWAHDAVDTLQHATLGWAVEINHHIAAEDYVKRLLERPIILDQIHHEKINRIAQFRLDPHESIIGALATLKEFVQLPGIDTFYRICTVHPLRCSL